VLLEDVAGEEECGCEDEDCFRFVSEEVERGGKGRLLMKEDIATETCEDVRSTIFKGFGLFEYSLW
jgi:hypothetical protein